MMRQCSWYQNSIALALSVGAGNTAPIANPQTGMSSLEAEVDYALVTLTFATVAGWLSVLSSGFLVQFVFWEPEQKNMFQPTNSGATASSVSVTNVSASPSSRRQPQYETVRHMVFGSVAAVQHTIKLLYRLNYAEPNDWSKPMPTGEPNEVMVVLTKRVRM